MEPQNPEEMIRESMAPVRQAAIGPMLVGRELEELCWEPVKMDDPRLTAHPDWLKEFRDFAWSDSLSLIHILRITKPRKTEWLAQNLDNPFRGWDGAEHIPAAAAKKAANQYRKTRSQLMKLAAEPGEAAQAQALEAVAAYTQTFNKMRCV